MKKQTLLDRRYPFWLALPAVIIFSVFFILPIIMGTGLSMTNWDMELARIDFVGLRNYVNIFSDKYYWMAAKNTLIFAVSILLLRNILALLLALCLTDKLKTRNFLRTIFYIPSVLSYIVVGILFTAILKSDGLLNRFLSALGFTAYIDWLGNGKIAMVSVIMLDVWMWTGFLAAIYIAGLQAIPRDYYEAARIDGANGVQQFFAISLPMLAPSLQICITLSLVGGIGAFEQILVLTNGPSHQCHPIAGISNIFAGNVWQGHRHGVVPCAHHFSAERPGGAILQHKRGGNVNVTSTAIHQENTCA